MAQTVAIARELARTHPAANLPCPVCAASLKAANLERHLAEMHQVGPQGVAPPPTALELVGVDRRVLWLTLLPGALWLLAIAAYVVLNGGPAQDDWTNGVLALWLLAAFALPVMVWLNLF